MMPSVILQTSDREVCRIECGSSLQSFAMRWNYVIRQRRRWLDDAEARDRQVERLIDELRRIGIYVRHLRRLKGVVQVSIPTSKTDRFWEARVLPWEYVLASATGPFRGEDSILVVRHLRTGRRRRTRQPRTYAIVETAPGELSGQIDFTAERRLVTSGMEALERRPEGVLSNPTIDQLRTELRSANPDIVHLTGIDNRSGRQILGRESEGVRDGLYLSDGAGNAEEHRAEKIASSLNKGSPNPLFVGFNCWDSGARVAPMTIQAGVSAAVGFQHTFDDEVAEVFFLNFYRVALQSGWNPLAGFYAAWESIASYRDRIRGSSLTLWSADSLIHGNAFDAFRRWRNDDRRGDVVPDQAGLKESPRVDPSRVRIEDLVHVTVRPKQQLNYSSLHNGENVFDEFTFRRDPGATRSGDGVSIKDIDVEVLLQIDTKTLPYRTRVQIDAGEYRRDLVDEITLPLTGEVFHSINERIHATIYVNVVWQNRVLHRHTYPVWLAPADQWTLDAGQIGWLPSFVQPRDPAVAKTIGIAQGYLQCLADRVSVGFDGYQSYDDFASGLDRWNGVDRQVRALWAALVFGTNLHYINPPPSYAEFTQRLRTPSDTLSGRFGTCVDLAILFSSCLEWIEVHPVLFLLNGHVFPGYWKDPQAHRRYMDVLIEDDSQPNELADLPDDHDSKRWVAGQKTYAEIKRFVDRGELIPIETVGLTRAIGYQTAIDEGRNHFYKNRSRNFRAMIDIVSARRGNGVTPLPIRFSSAPERIQSLGDETHRSD